MANKKESPIEKKEKKHLKKIIIILSLIAVIIIIVLFGTQIYLFINLLLGNDIIINLDSSGENFFAENYETQPVEFKVSITANPFCRVACNYSFEDISYSELIDSSTFRYNPVNPFSIAYNITAPLKGSGQKLYRFDIQCRGIKTALCRTKDGLTKESSLLTLDYTLNEQNNVIRTELKNKYNKTLNILSGLYIKSKELNNSLSNISEINLKDHSFELSNILSNLEKIKERINSSERMWENYEYERMFILLSSLESEMGNLTFQFEQLNRTVHSNISEYNTLVLNISSMESELSSGSINLTEGTVQEFYSIVGEFNSLKLNFTARSLPENKLLFSDLSQRYLSFRTNLSQENTLTPEISINNQTIPYISFSYQFSTPSEDYTLRENPGICCLFNNCTRCCDESCYYGPEKYPVIFIHGHDFSSGVSAEYNLNIFEEMQRELDPDYLNAGSILVNIPEKTVRGIWGKTPVPISVKASYYFDSVESEEELNIFQAKKDNIDTYSIRLKNIIDTVKYKTNRDKVILITHSMGGLVARRYIQIFGEEDVYKLIMLGSPNNGVDNSTLKYCKIFGAESECRDMHKDSILIGKLKAQEKPGIEAYNIMGIGCNTYSEPGDGVVTNRSNYLSWTKNYYINGTCDSFGFKYLHIRMVIPQEYPETYQLVKKILEKK